MQQGTRGGGCGQVSTAWGEEGGEGKEGGGADGGEDTVRLCTGERKQKRSRGSGASKPYLKRAHHVIRITHSSTTHWQ